MTLFLGAVIFLPAIFLTAIAVLLVKTPNFDHETWPISSLADLAETRKLYLTLAVLYLLTETSIASFLMSALFSRIYLDYAIIIIAAILALTSLPFKAASQQHIILMNSAFGLMLLAVLFFALATIGVDLLLTVSSLAMCVVIASGLFSFLKGYMRQWRAELVALAALTIWNLILFLRLWV